MDQPCKLSYVHYTKPRFSWLQIGFVTSHVEDGKTLYKTGYPTHRFSIELPGQTLENNAGKKVLLKIEGDFDINQYDAVWLSPKGDICIADEDYDPEDLNQKVTVVTNIWPSLKAS